MTVVGGLAIDRTQQLELLDDVGRLEGEDLEDGGEDFLIAHGAGAEGVHVHAHRQRVADGIGELHLALPGQAGSHDVLGNPAAHVGGGAVHLGRILAGEGTTAVAAHATVGVHDDLAPGEAGITLRTTHDELAGRVDQILGVLGEHVLGQHLLDHLLDAELLDGGMAHIRRVLGGDDHVDDAGGLAIDVFHRHLALGVRAQPLGELAGLADARELAAEAVRIHDRRGHELGRFIAGITEHDPLVPGTLLGVLLAVRLFRVHTLRDVGRLGGQVVVDENPVGVEHIVIVHITDATHGLTDHAVQIDHRTDGLLADLGNGDFTAHHDDVALHKGLAGHAALGVHLQAGVQDGIGNGVANLVGMAFTDGLGGKNVGAHGVG